MLVVLGPVMTRTKPARAGVDLGVAGVDEQGAAAEVDELLLGGDDEQRIVAERVEHARRELLVAAAEQEALAADHGDDRLRRARARPRRAARAPRRRRARGARRARRRRRAASSRTPSSRASSLIVPSGSEQVAHAGSKRGCRSPRRGAHGRLLVRRASPPCAPGCGRRSVRHRERAEEPRLDAGTPQGVLVDVEHLALEHGEATPSASHAAAMPPAARGLTANTGEYIFTPAGMPSAATCVARPASPRRHRARCRRRRRRARATRPRRRVHAAAADVSAAGRRLAAGWVDDDRLETGRTNDVLAHRPRRRQHARAAGCAEATRSSAASARSAAREAPPRSLARACTAAPSLPASPAGPPMPATGLTMSPSMFRRRSRPARRRSRLGRRGTCAGRRAR